MTFNLQNAFSLQFFFSHKTDAYFVKNSFREEKGSILIWMCILLLRRSNRLAELQEKNCILLHISKDFYNELE